MKGKHVARARERAKIDNKEAHLPRGDEEFESAIGKLSNAEMGSSATDGSLKDQANRAGVKAKLAPRKSNNKSKRKGEGS